MKRIISKRWKFALICVLSLYIGLLLGLAKMYLTPRVEHLVIWGLVIGIAVLTYGFVKTFRTYKKTKLNIYLWILTAFVFYLVGAFFNLAVITTNDFKMPSALGIPDANYIGITSETNLVFLSDIYCYNNMACASLGDFISTMGFAFLICFIFGFFKYLGKKEVKNA